MRKIITTGVFALMASSCEPVSQPLSFGERGKYFIADERAYAASLAVERLNHVEDSLMALAVGRFAGNEREHLAELIRPGAMGGVISVEDSIAADAISKIYAVRLRRANVGVDYRPAQAFDGGAPTTPSASQGVRRRMLSAGKVPVAIAIRDPGDPENDIVVIRRTNVEPHDVVLLPANAATSSGVRAALGAVAAVHSKWGVCPDTDAKMKVRGDTPPSPVTWGRSDQERASTHALKLSRAARLEIEGVGSVRSTTVWVNRTFGRDRVGGPAPGSGAFTSVC